MTYVNSLIERLFPLYSRELPFGETPISQIVEQYGTPIFIYVQEIVDKTLASLRNTLPQGFELHYSVKANPNREILRYFLSKSCGLEIASGGELYQALAAGALPENIIYAGPGKSDDELAMALEARVGELHVESFAELERIIAICRYKKLNASIAIRINPTLEARGGAMQMGGKASPFGFDEESLEAAVKMVLCQPELFFQGIHINSGSQILDHDVVITQYRKGFEIGRQVAEITGKPLITLDFGGGYGIPYFAKEQPLDMVQLRQGLDTLFQEFSEDPAFQGTRFIVEPGRYLIGESGIYITSVIDVKESRGKKFVIMDGGMHHHLGASGNLGQVIKRNFPIAALTKLDMEASEKVDIVGPLCTPLDTLGRSVLMPKVENGDLIGIFQSGAYARTASPMGFLSHPSPPEVWLAGDNYKLIRRRGTYADMVDDLR